MENENEKILNERKPTDKILLNDDATAKIRFPDAMLQANVWAGDVVRKWIGYGHVPDEQVTPNGVDLTVDMVFQQRGNVVLTKDKRDTKTGMLYALPHESISGLHNPGWFLEPGYYTIRWVEHVHIPSYAIGLLSPRSTLLRTCATVYGAVWDRGYHGIGESGLHVFNHLLLERGTALAQMCFIEASIGRKTYDGQYQGENVNAAKERKETD